MNYLQPLMKGDLVDVIAPGSSCSQAETEAALRYLHRLGYKARYREGSQKSFLYHSHRDDVRAEVLIEALLNNESKAIWCLRGGYGSNRLIRSLIPLKKPKKTKIFIGLSDVTSLHLFLNQKWNWPTWHAPVLVRMGSGDLSAQGKKEIKSLLCGDQSEIVFDGLKALNAAAENFLSSKSSSLRAECVGGNLMTLQSSIGTPVQLSSKGQFVFIEEVNERGYRIDRMLYHLHEAGAFAGARAVLLGEFIGGKEPRSPSGEQKSFVKLALKRFCTDMPMPVFGYLPVGHGYPQRTIPFRTQAHIEGHRLRVHAGFSDRSLGKK